MSGVVVELLGPSTGGIRQHVHELTAGLERRGWEVVVAGPAGVMDDVGRLDEVVPLPDFLDLRGLASARRGLQEVVARRRPDVIHAHGLKPGWLAASLRGRPPLVVSVHNLVLAESAGRSFRPLRALEAALPARAEALIAISDQVARRFTGVVGADRITVVPPVGPTPVVLREREEVRDELGIAADEHLLVTAARLHPQKGLDVLIDAVAQLRHEGLPVRAVVFGEGRLRRELTDRIDRSGLEEVVRLAGSRPSVADELAAADVVVVSSRWESGPLVVFEALQLGVPVVSTAVGVAPRVVVDGVTGRLVPTDDAGALAEGIRSVLADPKAAAAMAAEGRRLAAVDFGPDALVAGVEAVYRRVVDGGRRAVRP